MTPFNLTPAQADAWDLYASGKSTTETMKALGRSETSILNRIRLGAAKIPGERAGQKQAAWRKARGL